MQALDAVCGTSCLGEATPEKRQQAALRVLNSRRLLLVLDNLETLSAAATTALGNFLRQLDHRLGSLALLTLRPRQKNPLTDLAGRYVLPVDRLDLLSAVQLLVTQTAGLFSKIPPRPPTPAEKPQLSDFAGHLGFRPEALPQLASLKDLAEACHCHPRLMELALGDLRRPTTSFGAVIQRLQKLSGKDLQAAVDEMLGRMITALQAEAPEAVALLQIMTIFRGPAEVAALAAVHAGEEPEAFDEALNAGVDSSLLSAENDRVWLHSLTAQFLEKHAPLSEALAQTYRRRHAEYYLVKAQQYEEDNMEQWREFDVDWENIAAAADWVAALPVEQKEQAELVGDFALAVKDVVYWRKLPAEKWLLAGAAAFARLENKKREGLMYNQIGLIYNARGDYDAALQWYQKSVAIQETLGDRAGLAASYNNIGMIYNARGDYDAALQWYQKSVAIKEALGDRARLATSYNNIGEVNRARGDYDAALQWYQKSVAIQETLGDRAGLATSYNNIGEVNRARGDYDAALQWYQKSIAINEALGDRAGMATSYNNIGMIYDARGDYDAALQWYQKSVAIQETLGDRAGLATSYNNIGMIYKARGDYDDALQWYEKSVAIQEALGDRAGLAASYSNIGKVYHAQGEYDAAFQWHKKSLEIKESIGNRAGIATSYNEIGLIYDARGDYDAALQWYQKSVAINEQLGNRAVLATSYNNIASVQYARGDYDAALQWYQKSVAIQEALGDRAGLATSYSNIGSIQYARGDYDAALQWYQKSIEILEVIGDRAHLASALHNMGYVAQAQQDWPTALAYFTRSRDLYQQIGLEKKAQKEEALIAEVQEKMR